VQGARRFAPGADREDSRRRSLRVRLARGSPPGPSFSPPRARRRPEHENGAVLQRSREGSLRREHDWIIMGRPARGHHRFLGSPAARPMKRVKDPDEGDEGRLASSTTSRSLLEGIRADDPSAWDRLVNLYAPLVFRLCRRWDLPEQEIADVAQDVFQAVATHVAGFRRERPGDTFRG